MKTLLILASIFTITSANAGRFDKNLCDLKLEDKIVNKSEEIKAVVGTSYDGHYRKKTSRSEIAEQEKNYINQRENFLKSDKNVLEAKCSVSSRSTEITYTRINMWDDAKYTYHYASFVCKTKEFERISGAKDINYKRQLMIHNCIQNLSNDSDLLKLKSLEMDFHDALREECTYNKIAVKSIETPAQLAQLIESAKTECNK